MCHNNVIIIITWLHSWLIARWRWSMCKKPTFKITCSIAKTLNAAYEKSINKLHGNYGFNTVPLDLNLTLASMYSRALTPFPRAVSWCSRASATCSRAWINSWRSRVYYSRALTPFHRAVGRCSRASVICSRAWFYVQMKHTARVHYSSSIQYMLASKP